jgi:hypothetical protein
MNWKWLNRCVYSNNKTPLVILHQNRVVAHAGMIPFKLTFDHEVYSAAWFIDFKILSEFQRFGLGSMLTNQWMTFSDCCLTFCNEKSIGVFKKFGWVESFETYMHLHFILPFDHPGFVRRLPSNLRKILNKVVCFYYYWIYSRCSYTSGNYNLDPLTDVLFDEFYALYLKNLKFNSPNINFRDSEYVKWRIINSPNKSNYYVYKVTDFIAIVSLQNNHGKYIDVLWVSNLSNENEIVKMIASLSLFGLNNSFAYLRFFTNKKSLSDLIKGKLNSIVSHPRFAFFSRNRVVFEKLKTLRWDFELIDSDFEHFK